MKKLFTILMLTAMSFGASTTFAQTTPAVTQHLKKDGTPDKRYKAGKTTSTPATATRITTVSSTPSSDVHIKADGTPDKRYKTNKSAAVPSSSPSTAPVTSAATPSSVPVQTTSATPNTGRHLKKDGTPDMRYKENRTAGVDKNGKPDMRYKKNKATN